MDNERLSGAVRSFKRHIDACNRVLTERVDHLVKKTKPTKAEEEELYFLSKTLRPPIDACLKDYQELSDILF